MGVERHASECSTKGGTLEAMHTRLACRESEFGPLVCPVGKNVSVRLRRLAPQAILRVCEERRREASVPEFAAHGMRHSYISALPDQGVDLSLASEPAGRSSRNTNRRNDRRGERARHAAAASPPVPYMRSPRR